MPIINDLQRLKRTPEAYIKFCGGPHQALQNFKTLNYQCDPGFELPKWWMQVKALCEKALGQQPTSLEQLRKERESARKLAEVAAADQSEPAPATA